MITIKEMAALAGVSPTTKSDVAVPLIDLPKNDGYEITFCYNGKGKFDFLEFVLE